MLFLISLFFGLNSAPTCTYDEENENCNDLTGNEKIFYECKLEETTCTLQPISCEKIESKSASTTICPQATTEDSDSKCIYDSKNKVCKEALKCLSVTSPSEENCKSAPTTDDTKKKCSYNESKKKCEEVDKPADETNGGSDMRKSLALIFFICLL